MAIVAFYNINTASANGVSGEALAASRNTMVSLEGVSIVTLLVGIALAIFLARFISKPLGNINLRS